MLPAACRIYAYLIVFIHIIGDKPIEKYSEHDVDDFEEMEFSSLFE